MAGGKYSVKFERTALLSRAVLEAVKDGHKVRLYSRNGNDFTRRFARISACVSQIKADSVVLDGEAVAVDEQGIP